jgi:cyclase
MLNAITWNYCGVISVPLITVGGCGLAQNSDEGYQLGVAHTSFCQRDQNPMQCRSHISNAGLPIRLEV